MKIDTERVIFEVHLRSCLWDKKNALYKNRDARDAAWLEICEELVPGFQNLTKNEKTEIEKKIQQRWRTARDMYKRDKLSEYQPSGSGAKRKKKYAYYNIMTFLDTVMDTITDDSLTEISNSAMPPSPSTTEVQSPATSATPHQSIAEAPLPSTSATAHHSAPAPRGKKNKQPSEFEKSLLECLKSNQLELESEDLAFFQSLQPTLKKFTNFQKMMFRTKVLQIIMDMENPSTQIHNSPSNMSGSSSSHTYYSTPSPYDIQRQIPETRSYDNTVMLDIDGNMLISTYNSPRGPLANTAGIDNYVPAGVGDTIGTESYTASPVNNAAQVQNEITISNSPRGPAANTAGIESDVSAVDTNTDTAGLQNSDFA